MARLTFFAVLLALPFAPLHAQPAPAITEDSLRAHIAVLADDAMEGREAGTAGERLAAEYIAQHMAQYGLEAAFGDYGYYQPVALIERLPGSAELGWQHDGERIAIPSSEMVLIGRAPTVIVEARTIFGGYGHDLDEEGGGRLGTMDLNGAAVLLLAEFPDEMRGPALAMRRELLVRRGAVAVIALSARDYNWEAIAPAVRERGRISLFSDEMAPIEGSLSPQASAVLLELASLTPDTAPVIAAAPDFLPIELDYTLDARVETSVRNFTAYNVAARLEGAGGGDEAVLMMAHYDHTGICRPEGEADRICNGAVDNGSGVAVLLETARVLAAGPQPVRDVLFVATTAEEMGLLGARALIATPIVSVETIVAALNLDTVAIVPAGMPVAILGRGRTGLDSVVDAVTREIGRTVDPDNEADAFLQRQDGWALMEAGIPSIMVGGSFSDMARLMAYIEGPYHQPNDDLASIPDLGGALDDANLHVALVRALADPGRWAGPGAGGGGGE